MTELVIVLGVVAAACALPGVFLVLRRMSLVSDAIGHVLLLGIVLAYFITREIQSPWLLVGAMLTGMATVVLVELLQRTRLVQVDAAIGLVFPALFALGVLLVTIFVPNVHIDVDAVLVGQPELANEPRWDLFGFKLQPLTILTAVLLLNIGLCVLLYKELKVSTFDAGLAATLGFPPGGLHYGLMAVVCVTAVAAFDAVGPVLVVGFFVLPAATALLLTERLSRVLVIAVAVGVLGAVIGVRVADRLDANTAGSVATALGLLFALAFLFSPIHGQVVQLVRRRKQRLFFEETMLVVHLYQHEGTQAEAEEARLESLHRHLSWPPERVLQVVNRALAHGTVVTSGSVLKLTDHGRQQAQAVIGDLNSTDTIP
jgi:manganese/zinc/iron transport system permease protein